MARCSIAALGPSTAGRSSFPSADHGAAALRSGDAAPAFVGENYDGQQVTLASATGPKGLVLWFYPKAGTGG